VPAFTQFLSASDAQRALSSFRKLARRGIGRWVLTGGLATEFHRLRAGCRPYLRPLNDIDFIAESFDCIPESLADDFLFRHIHPADPPGKTMLQCIDPESALRIDVFRAYGGTLGRAIEMDLPVGPMRMISLEDLAARMARLALEMVQCVMQTDELFGGPVGRPIQAADPLSAGPADLKGRLRAKLPAPHGYAGDFLRLTELVEPAAVETAWRDHGKPGHPATFAETDKLLRDLIPERQHLLIERDYSKDYLEVCPRCSATTSFQFADPKTIFDLLGYA
jgi:hypothetical protein